MALSKLSADEHGIILGQLCNALEPRLAVYFSSASSGLRVLLTPALLQQLKADYEAAAAVCLKVGTSCKELRKARIASWHGEDLSAADLATLATLGSMLPALEVLTICQVSFATGPGLQRLTEGLGVGALPAVTHLGFAGMRVGDAGASALAAALGRGALPRLMSLALHFTAIGDAGLVALAPALRRGPALEGLYLASNPFGDEGLAALVAPPPAAGAPPPLTAGLAKLSGLNLNQTHVTDAGCATLVAALNSGALPALKNLGMGGIPAGAVARASVLEAVAASRAVPT